MNAYLVTDEVCPRCHGLQAGINYHCPACAGTGRRLVTLDEAQAGVGAVQDWLINERVRAAVAAERARCVVLARDWVPKDVLAELEQDPESSHPPPGG